MALGIIELSRPCDGFRDLVHVAELAGIPGKNGWYFAVDPYWQLILHGCILAENQFKRAVIVVDRRGV